MTRIERLFIALIFALLAAGTTLIIAGAQPGTIPPVQTSPDCATCHTDTEVTWQNGAHGKSGSNPVFLAEWTKQGKPGACLVCHTTGYDPATATYEVDGVSCESCHSPVPTDHPKSPMPAASSTELCTRCHSDTRFEPQNGEAVTHYERGLDCVACHDPHSTSLKTMAGPRTVERADEASQLCITCHQEANMDFPLTAHAQENVACVDCHVKGTENGERGPHTVPDHSFSASIVSCNTCHEQQMHSPTEAVNTKETGGTVSTEPTPAIQLSSITLEPGAVSPIGFSAMAGLIGLAGGMVVAPWLERWYRRVAKQNREENDERD